MHRSPITLALAVVALVHVSATTRQSDDAARRLAIELQKYLKAARIESVEFRLNHEKKPRLRLSQRDEIAGIVKSFVEALTAVTCRRGNSGIDPRATSTFASSFRMDPTCGSPRSACICSGQPRATRSLSGSRSG
jgi:hypothetical protein